MSEDDQTEGRADDPGEGHHRPHVPQPTSRAPALLALAGVGLVMAGIAVVIVPNLDKATRPDARSEIAGASLEPVKTLKQAVKAARSTSRLAAESIRAVLNRVDPQNHLPPELPFEISFTPNEAVNGGRLVLDLGDGIVIDYITVSGKVTCDFSVALNTTTNTLTVTITMGFDEALVHLDEDEDSDAGVQTVELNGAVTATTVLQGRVATCTFAGPLEVRHNKTTVKVFTGEAKVTVDGHQRTIVFNGSSFVKVNKPLLPQTNYRLTWVNLLMANNQGSLDVMSGRFKVEKLTGLIKWTQVYVFLHANGGEVTIYPGGLKSEFTLEPPEDYPPPAPVGFTATAVSGSQVDLSWQNASTGEVDMTRSFVVERRPVNGTWKKIAGLKANVTSFSDTALERSNAYEYRVTAGNHRGDSPEAEAAAITLPAPLKVLSMSPTRGKRHSNVEVVFTVQNCASNVVGAYFHRDNVVSDEVWSSAQSVQLDASGNGTITVKLSSFADTGPVTIVAGGQKVPAGTFTVE